jgi:hypothetical protein
MLGLALRCRSYLEHAVSVPFRQAGRAVGIHPLAQTTLPYYICTNISSVPLTTIRFFSHSGLIAHETLCLAVMTDEFQHAIDRVAGSHDSKPPAVAEGESTHGIPELVSEVYERSSSPLRAKILECLLRPVGPLALAAIATGAFGHLLYRLRRDAAPIPLDESVRITSNHVLDLARYVEQCSPDALLQVASLIADRPIGVATTSAAALLIALSLRKHLNSDWDE